MDTVTESHMAVSMGGIGILHSNAASSDQAAMVRSVKARRVPFLSTPVFMSPGDRIHNNDVFDHGANPYVLVTESGAPSSKLLGYVASRDWEKLADLEVKIYDYMIEEFMAEKGRDVVATVRDDEVVDVVGKEDVERIRGYPKLGVGSVGPDGS
ncbi:putative IMP dehydrogenase [Rosa chinensis]|uniref:Putative IMP dehydrogenase n=1 Tax=Rosa chinensis TaxID=74649 RepID=A0A2P6Q844_ROSCH|nr:putative IMP dehydrogenase [Rosa chinensis]